MKKQQKKTKEITAPVYMMNRELSWLKFNERVLNEAGNPRVPLAERLTFAAIYQSNLDEFYRVRVGTLMDQMEASEVIRENKTNMTSEEQVTAILQATRDLDQKKAAIYEQLMGELEPYGVRLINFNRLSAEEGKLLETYFDQEIAPYLSANIVSKQQPFPFLKNKNIYAVASLMSKGGKTKTAIIPCSNTVFRRLIDIPTRKGTFMLSEELILHFLPKVFAGYKILSKSLMRITRNADIDADALYDEDLDYREFMVELIKARKKLAPIRLELSREMDGDVVETLCDYLDVNKNFVFRGDTPLDLSFVFQIQDGLRKKTELFYEKRIPQKSPQFNTTEPILDQIAKKDRFLSYPYESIKPFLTMLHEAANDKDVVSIKMTLYRVAKQSKVVEALIEAAENGKEVFVLVELKARFDEENNIEWSRLLEDAGCHVIYGLDGYKVHSKLCQIVKKKGGNVEYYTQIGTGNYNEKTARLYTDLSLMTADPKIGTEAAQVFQALAMGETVEDMDHLLVAPKCLQNKVLAMIDTEIEHAKAGEPSYIGLKMKSLTDKRIIDKLAEASCAGVHIDMIVRGICCLIPEVEGKTENIHIISIVGRFLEHSRIYIFGTQERAKIYIASADFMTRNTLRRVEVAAPIEDPDIRMQIQEMFVTMLSDNRKARKMNSKGNYKIEESDNAPLNSQEVFLQQAYANTAAEGKEQ